MNYSVIIPLYNKAPYVKESLQSIVDQTRWPDEIIVIDDKSTDRSAEVVEAFFAAAPEAFLKNTRTMLVRLPENGGISVARNAGLITLPAMWSLFSMQMICTHPIFSPGLPICLKMNLPTWL